jgi:hypothetical protein
VSAYRPLLRHAAGATEAVAARTRTSCEPPAQNTTRGAETEEMASLTINNIVLGCTVDRYSSSTVHLWSKKDRSHMNTEDDHNLNIATFYTTALWAKYILRTRRRSGFRASGGRTRWSNSRFKRAVRPRRHNSHQGLMSNCNPAMRCILTPTVVAGGAIPRYPGPSARQPSHASAWHHPNARLWHLQEWIQNISQLLRCAVSFRRLQPRSRAQCQTSPVVRC